MKDVLRNAKLDGFFTNHSLHRTGTSQLFQAGIDKKLVKDYSGHRSDAPDQYQIISEQQKETISKVLTCLPCPQIEKKDDKVAQSYIDAQSSSETGTSKVNECKCERVCSAHHKIYWVLNFTKIFSFFGLVGFNHLLGEMPLQSKSVAQTTIEINEFPSHRHQSNVVLHQ